MQARALHLPLLLAAVAPPAGAWISTSQVRCGTQINDIQLEAYGESLQNSYKSLGWLWTSPDRTHNDAGDAGPGAATYAIARAGADGEDRGAEAAAVEQASADLRRYAVELLAARRPARCC